MDMFIAASLDPLKSIPHTWKPSFSYPSAFRSEHAEVRWCASLLAKCFSPKPLAFCNLLESYFNTDSSIAFQSLMPIF